MLMTAAPELLDSLATIVEWCTAYEVVHTNQAPFTDELVRAMNVSRRATNGLTALRPPG